MIGNTTEEQECHDRISAAVVIVEDLKNVVTVICLRSVNGVMVFGLGTKGCVEGGSRCLAYVGKDLIYIHLTHIQ